MRTLNSGVVPNSLYGIHILLHPACIWLRQVSAGPLGFLNEQHDCFHSETVLYKALWGGLTAPFTRISFQRAAGNGRCVS